MACANMIVRYNGFTIDHVGREFTVGRHSFVDLDSALDYCNDQFNTKTRQKASTKATRGIVKEDKHVGKQSAGTDNNLGDSNTGSHSEHLVYERHD